MSARLLLLAAAAVGALWSFQRWRAAVQLAMVLLVLEGALRKWVLPGAQDLIYFAKDGILLAAYAGFLNDRSARIRAREAAPPPVLVGLLVASAFVGLLQVFNPNLPNMLVGLFGFKAYFLYVPLLWVLPGAFERREDLWRFLYLYALLAIPLGLLALAQFTSPASSAINSYARPGESTAFTFGTSTRVRVTATFSFITGYTSYLFATALLVLGLLGTVGWKIRPYLTLYAAFGLTLVGMLATGSRAPVFMFTATFPLYWWLTMARDRQGFEAVSRILVIAAFLGIFLASTASDLVEAFYGRAIGGTDVPGRLLTPFVQPFEVLGEAGPIGFGIGATHQAAIALVGDLQPGAWLKGLAVEDEGARIMLEQGIFGFVLIYASRLYLLFWSFRQAVVLRDRFCRAFAVASFVFFLTSLPSGIVFNVTAGLYYWFFGGLLFLATRLDREVAIAEAAAPAASARASRPLGTTGTGSRSLPATDGSSMRW